MSNINFLTADVINLLANAKIAFSQEATDLQEKIIGSQTACLVSLFTYSPMQGITMSCNSTYQVIPGYYQNTTPANQKTAGSKLNRTS